VLLNIADDQLNFEVVGVLPGDLVQPVENRFEPRQVTHSADLLIQTL